MTPGQSKLPSDSIKVVPGRSKLRVESSNPVARGNPVPRPSKVKLITPEEALKLHSGVTQVPVPPPSECSRPYKLPCPTFQSRLKPVPATFESQRREPTRATFESQRPYKPVPATFESQRREPTRATFESSTPKPVPATFESQRPKPTRVTFEVPRHVQARPSSKPPRPVSTRPTYEPPRPVPPRPTSKPPRPVPRSVHQPKTVELPPSPSALQIPSKVQQQATKDTVVEVGDEAKETCQSTSEERISELLLYRPALLPTWKGRIVDSAMLFPEFDCQFRANPASNISKKALRLSKAMPIFLEVELLPTGYILSDLFGRIPRLSDVELYFFLHEKETERSKREHAHLFEAMATRNAMIKANVNGAELLLFSSKLLDKTSQFFIKKQTKTENYLWGFFLHKKKYSQALALDDANVVDMDIDPEDQTPWSSTHSSSQGKLSKEVSLPPCFEKIWTPLSSRPCGSCGERPCSYR